MAMANNIFIFFLLFTINIALLPSLATAAYCGGSCSSWDDCDGQLICINGRCNDDPDVGTHICRSRTPSPGPNCRPSGTIYCNGETKATYTCSPPITGSTSAILTLNDFSEGGDGGGPSECDDRYHDNSERVVALSTGWFANRSRCLRMIRITAQNGRSTTAKVVDECDSRHGCDAEHAYQLSCDNNIVDGSDAVWRALGLNQDLGRVPITWSMA